MLAELCERIFLREDLFDSFAMFTLSGVPESGAGLSCDEHWLSSDGLKTGSCSEPCLLGDDRIPTWRLYVSRDSWVATYWKTNLLALQARHTASRRGTALSCSNRDCRPHLLS